MSEIVKTGSGAMGYPLNDHNSLKRAERTELQEIRKGFPNRVWRSAILLAQGHSVQEVADGLHVSPSTVHRWLRRPHYAAAFQLAHQRATLDVEKSLFLDRRQRLKKLVRQAERIENTIEQKAADPSVQGIPGGREGLTSTEGRFESSLDKAYRETLEQLAREAGDSYSRQDNRTQVTVQTSVITTSDTASALVVLQQNEQAREI